MKSPPRCRHVRSPPPARRRHFDPFAGRCPCAVGIDNDDFPYFALVLRYHQFFQPFQAPSETPAGHRGPSIGWLWMKRSSSSSLKSWPLPFTFTISISPPSGMSVRVHVAVARSNGSPAWLTTNRNGSREIWLRCRSSRLSLVFRLTRYRWRRPSLLDPAARSNSVRRVSISSSSIPLMA